MFGFRFKNCVGCLEDAFVRGAAGAIETAMGAANSQLAEPLPTADTAVATRPSLELAVCRDARRTPGSADEPGLMLIRLPPA